MNVLQIRTGARLHLGLLEIKSGESSRFGGLGTMIDAPGFLLTANPAETWECASESNWTDRIQRTAQDWLKHRHLERLPGLRISVDRSPPPHAGFGSGTQLACCVASLLELAQDPDLWNRTDSQNRWQATSKDNDDCWQSATTIWAPKEESNQPHAAYQNLLTATQRGKRSHIGLAGFLHGGWIFDRGQLPLAASLLDTGEPNCLPPDAFHRWSREQAPVDWRVILANPKAIDSIHGDTESNMFRCSETKPNPHRVEMLRLIESQILPGLRSGRFELFHQAIGQYGRYAGKIFEDVQHGIYRSSRVGQIVDAMQELGLHACGQSSWGPTTFAIVPTESQAKALLPELRDRFPDTHWTMARFASIGAQWRSIVR